MFEDKGFELLKQTLEHGVTQDLPIAAVLSVEGKFYTPFKNEVYLHKSHLHHAEVLAINHALKELDRMDFKGLNATLYSSLEPCCMCLAFACLVRIKKVVFYAWDGKFGGVERIFTLNSAFTKPEIICIEKPEIKTLMNNFFLDKR